MKKLLSLLSVLTLSTTASIPVVACGSVSKEEDSEDSTGEDVISNIDSQIKYLQNKIQKTVSKYYSQNLTKFIEGVDEGSTSSNSFLTFQKLKEIIDSNQEDEGEINYDLVESEPNDLISDIKTKIEYDSIKEEINAYDENTSLISQNIESFIDDNSLSIQNGNIKISPVYENGDTNGKMVQIKVDFNLQINYKYNQSDEIQNGSVVQPISWSIFENDEIGTIMNNVAQNLSTTMYNDGDLNFTENDFGISNNPFIPADNSDFLKDATVNKSLLAKIQEIIASKIVNVANDSSLVPDDSVIGTDDVAIDGFSIEEKFETRQLKTSTKLFSRNTNEFENNYKASGFYSDLNTKISSLSASFISFSENYGLDNADDLSKYVSSWGTFIVQGITFNYTLDGSTTAYQFNDIVLPYNYQITNKAAYDVFNAYGVDETNTLAERFTSDAGTSGNLLLDNYQYVVAYQILVFIDKFGIQDLGTDTGNLWTFDEIQGDDNDFFHIMHENYLNKQLSTKQWQDAWNQSTQYKNRNEGMGSIGGNDFTIQYNGTQTFQGYIYEEWSSVSGIRKFSNMAETFTIHFGNVYFTIYDSQANAKEYLMAKTKAQ